MHRAMMFVPAALLGVGVLLINGIREQIIMPPLAPMSSLPDTYENLVGSPLTVSEDEQRVAGMSDYVMRVFGPDSMYKFSVYVGYYDHQVQGKTIHSPKNCLPGAGWEVMENEKVPLSAAGMDGQATRVILGNQGTRALVYYWYQGRDRIEANEYTVKWDLLRDAAMYGRTEEALVRIVVPMVPDPANPKSLIEMKEEASRLAQSVAEKLAADVQAVMPKLRGV